MDFPISAILMSSMDAVFIFDRSDQKDGFFSLLEKNESADQLIATLNDSVQIIWQDILRRGAQGGKPVEDHIDIQDKKNSNKIHRIHYRAVPLDSMIVLSFREVPDLSGHTMQLTEKNEFLSYIIENLPVSVFCKDLPLGFRYIIYNKTNEELLSIPRADLLGKNDYEVFPKDIADFIREKDLEIIKSRKKLEIPEEELNTKDHGRIWVRTTKVPFFDRNGQPKYLFGITQDITEQKRAHDEMLKAHEELEARVIQRTQELEEARKAADSASQIKSVFLANMSHELRTPLGAILGFIELMRQTDLKKEDLEKYLGIISRNSRQVLRIIDDILDLSKVEAGKMMIEETDFSLQELLEDLSSLMDLKARDHGINFEFKAMTLLPTLVSSDPTRVRQILANILDNAIKFTEHGYVELSVSYGDPYLEFKVTDTGRGISEEQAKKLFAPFAQADSSTTRRYGGTGLGLVLAKELSHALGGDFWLERSELGKGSVFVFRIKIKIPPESQMTKYQRIKPSDDTMPANLEFGRNQRLKGMKILLVEDSPDNQILVNIFLKKAGAEVITASNGKEGVEWAQKEDFDAILMDVQMPVMDGYGATLLLREIKYEKPIIALTAHVMKEEQNRTIAAGFSDFIPKPVQRSQLIEVLMKYKPPHPASKKNNEATF